MGPRQLLLPPNTYVLLSPGTYVTVCLSPPTSIVKGCSACTWTWGEGGSWRAHTQQSSAFPVSGSSTGTGPWTASGYHSQRGTHSRPACRPAPSAAAPWWGWPGGGRTPHHEACPGRRSGQGGEVTPPPLPSLPPLSLTCLDRSSLLVRNHWSLLRKPGSLWMTSSSSTRQA